MSIVTVRGCCFLSFPPIHSVSDSFSAWFSISLHRVMCAILPCERIRIALCIHREPRVLAPAPRPRRLRAGGGRGPHWFPTHAVLRIKFGFTTLVPGAVHWNLSAALLLCSVFFRFICCAFLFHLFVNTKVNCLSLSTSCPECSNDAGSESRLVGARHVEGRAAAKLYFLLPNTSSELRLVPLNTFYSVSATI